MLGRVSLLWSRLVKSKEIASALERLTAYAQKVLLHFGIAKLLSELPIVERVGSAFGHLIYIWIDLDEHTPTQAVALRLTKVTLTYGGEGLVLRVWLVASKTPIGR